MSLATLLQNSKSTQATPAKTDASKTGLSKLVANSQPVQAAPVVPTPTPQSLFEKVAGGAQKVTDFLGLHGTTDTIANLIAKATVPANERQYVPTPTPAQLAGSAAQIASLLVPATGAERIGASLAEGATARAIGSGALAGAQSGALAGVGSGLQAPNPTASGVVGETLKQGTIGAATGGALGAASTLAGKGLAKLIGKSKPIEVPEIPPEEPPGAPPTLPATPQALTPAEKQAAYAKSQGYEPYTPPEQLPTIQVGPKAASELPTIQTTPKATAVKGDLTYEPIKEPTPEAPRTAPTEALPTKTTEATPKAPKVPTTGKTVTKAASDINKTLVKQGFDAIPEEEQAKYTPTTKAEQIEKIGTLMDTDIEKAKDMATGKIPVAKGILPQPLFNAVEAHATQEGDGELLRALAKSPHATKLSESAQTLGSHGYNDNANSPTKVIADVQKAREETAAARGDDVVKTKNDIIQKETPRLNSEIKKATIRESYNEFIDSIQC